MHVIHILRIDVWSWQTWVQYLDCRTIRNNVTISLTLLTLPSPWHEVTVTKTSTQGSILILLLKSWTDLAYTMSRVLSTSRVLPRTVQPHWHSNIGSLNKMWFRHARFVLSIIIFINDILICMDNEQVRNQENHQKHWHYILGIHKKRAFGNEMRRQIDTRFFLRPVNRQWSHQGKTKCISTTSKILIHCMVMVRNVWKENEVE